MYSSEFQAIIDRRRSNRKFDPLVEVPAEVIKKSLERAILSPNSSNMQLWEFYWIRSEEEKKKYEALCLGQNAARSAKEIVVFVTRKDLWKKHAKWNYDRLNAGINGEPNKLQKRGLDYYGKLMPLAYRSDIATQTLRGNIHTRLEKLITHPFDAIILAAAGLERMNLQSKIKQIIPSEVMLPSCGQGALGIECRVDDINTQSLVAPIHNQLTATCVTVEREINRLLGGNCHVPVAIYCQVQDQTRLLLRAKVLSPDGRRIVQGISSGPIEDTKTLTELCAEQLFSQGAMELLHSI
jgi:nitroreductase